MSDITNGTYHLGEYREFIICEPKRRIIRALPYIDRIVHQWYIEEFIKPYYMKCFISNTYACIDTRGSHKAVSELQKSMRKMRREYTYYYIIKCDVKKYFESIDKDILFRILSAKIRDKRLIDFTYKMIYENNNYCGICIGNYTSQYFANIYLNELDYYVKQELKIKYYFRYMDDFVLLISSLEEASNTYSKVEKYLNTVLKLELNKKSKYYPNKLGIDFCGYVIYENYIKIRKRCKNKINKKIRLWNYLYLNNRFNKKKFILSYNSFLGHIGHSNSNNFKKSIDKKILFLCDK